MKAKSPKKTSTVIITLTLTVVIVTSIIIGVILLIKNANRSGGTNIGKGSEVATGEFYDNGWDSSVVVEIREGNVPVPVGFEYVSGEKDTGIIVKNSETGKKYVWVPYEENPITDEQTDEMINQTIETLFAGKEAVSTNPDKLAEIQKYGGFYAGIEDYETYSEASSENTLYLGDMTLEQYKLADSVIQSQDANIASVNGSIMGREELESIVRFDMSQEEGSAISTDLLFGSAFTYKYLKAGTVYYNKLNFDKKKKKPDGTPTTLAYDKKVAYFGDVGDYYELYSESIYYYVPKNTKLYDSFADMYNWRTIVRPRIVKGASYGVNMYEDISLQSRLKDTIENGTEVTLLSATTNSPVPWAKISYGSYGSRLEGYVPFGALAEVEENVADSVNWEDVDGYIFLKAKAKMYEDATTDAEYKELSSRLPGKTAQKGTVNGTTWYKTKYVNDVVYIKSGDACTTYADCFDWTSVTGNKTRYITRDGVNVRSDVSSYGDLKTTVNKGTKIELISVTENRYAKIKVNNIEGYIAYNDFSETNPSSGGSGSGSSGGSGGGNSGGTTTPTNPPTTPSTPTENTTTENTTIENTTTENTTTENTTENTTTEQPTTEEPEEAEPKRAPAYTGEVVTIKPGRQQIKEEEVPDEWKGNVAKVVNGVPIPVGFEVSEYYSTDPNTGLVIKQSNTKESEETHRICYVWIPVNKDENSIETLGDAKAALNKIYTDNGLNTTTSEKAVESLPEELVNSVKEYGGFYISQGELGFDNNAKLYNRPRGMIESEINGWYHVDIGNYFRYVTPENRGIKVTTVNYVAAEAAYDGIISGMTMEKIHKVCEQLSTDSVTSHLTYGAEWDAMMLWLLKNEGKGWLTREGTETELDLTKTLLSDSTLIGKYSGHMFNAALTNNVWGLGGNLAEITQEKVDGKIVVRGGSYATLGTEYPIASRWATDEEALKQSTDHGFRNCIYINLPEEMEIQPIENTINNTVNDTENIEAINGMTNTTNTVDQATPEEESELAELINSEKEVGEPTKTVKDAEGKSITVPQGFTVTKDAYLIKDGVVIQNGQGDQFVWIPVENISEMYDSNNKTGKLYNITKTGNTVLAVTDQTHKNFEPGVVTGSDGKKFDAASENLQSLEKESAEKLEIQLQDEFNSMIQSVTTHKGFYVARYETGEISHTYPVSKKDSDNRTNLSWYEAYMITKNIPSGYYGITGLAWGCQWDMMLKWLQSCDGTGNTLNHIEDLKNGKKEWTMEAFSNDARIYRDVDAPSDNLFDEAGARVDINPETCTDTLASRAMMYIR